MPAVHVGGQGSYPRGSHVGFMVDKVSLGQDLAKY